MAPFGAYLHIPFCAKRCDYCAFATWTDREHLVEQYLAACRTEVLRATAAGMPIATSIFVGGGTPSLVPAAGLLSVLDAIPRTDDAEVSVECNPDTITPELVAAYAAGGVNRLSFGVQSMVPHVLSSLGRTHDPANVERAVAAARAAGFTSFNLDVIYGAVGETLADWRHTLEAVVALDPPHVSAYALTVEPGTPLAADAARHPDDDEQADKYLLATELLGAAGYEWYEISNWALPGHECRHNLALLEPGRLHRLRLRSRTPTGPGGAGGTSALRSATSTRSRRAAPPRAAPRSSTTTPVRSSASSSPCAPPKASPPTRSTSTSWATSCGSTIAVMRSSPCPAASWPARWRCAFAREAVGGRTSIVPA